MKRFLVSFVVTMAIMLSSVEVTVVSFPSVSAITVAVKETVAYANDPVNFDASLANNNDVVANGGQANSNQNQSQSEWQKQKQMMQSNITTPGNLPVASTHGIAQPANQTGDYGRLITTAKLESTAGLFCAVTGTQFATMVKVIDKEGKEDWEDINKKIIPYPIVRNIKSPLSREDKIYFPNGKMADAILRTTKPHQIVGGWFYDTKFKKDNSVQPHHLQMRAQMDAAKYGANVIIALDEFDQRYFVPESYEFSLAGVISWISSRFTSGGSVAGQAGVAKGQNTSFARPGAGFIFLRIEGVTDDICLPPVVEEKKETLPAPVVVKEVCSVSIFEYQINLWSDATRYCPDPCWNNATLRFQLGNSNAGAFDCTGDERYARQAWEEYDAAERDILNGAEPSGARTKNLASGKKLLQDIRFNKSWIIYKLYGREKQFEYAREQKLNGVPTNYEDLVKFN